MQAEEKYKSAQEKYNALTPEEKALANKAIEEDLKKHGIDLSKYDEKDKQAVIRDEYIRQTVQREGIGNMGDGFSKGIDAATSIVIGIIKGDITGGLAGASAPYLATLIKEQTGHYDAASKTWITDNKAANLVAHAILGAVVAELQGNSGLSGGIGAVTGEVAAEFMAKHIYGKDVKGLTEAEKRNISSLAQLASGLAVASVGGNTGDIAAAIASSKNAVENNSVFFGVVEPEIKLTEETKDVYDICPKYDSSCITAYFYSKGQPSPYPNVTIPKEVIEASTLLPSVGLADSISIAYTGKNLAGDEVDPLWGWLGIITAGYGQKARVIANFENKVVSATIKNSTGKEATSTTSNKGGSVSNPKEQSSNPVSKPAEVEIGKEVTTTGQTSSSTSKPTSSVSNETVSTTPNKGGSVSNPKEQSSSSVSKPAEAGKGMTGTTSNGYKVSNGADTIIAKTDLDHPIVQSRINVQNGNNKGGWAHVVDRHFSDKNASQFTISQSELKTILQSNEVSKVPISRVIDSADGLRYERVITFDKNIGVDKFSKSSTNTMTILTDAKGNLITTTPGRIK